MSNKRVLIAGAGPTGLTAAVELARRGIQATVIDRREEASGFSRAVGILPRSLDILEPSGVTSRLLAEGVRLHGVRFYRDQRQLLSLPIMEIHPQKKFILALAQDRTEAIMREIFLAQGGEVTYGLALTSFRQEADSVMVRVSDGRELEFEYLIGADGVCSTTREMMGLEYPGHDLPETWSIADVDARDWPNAGWATFCFLSEGRISVVVPLEPERFRVISNTPDALKTLPLDMHVQHVRREGQFHISIRQVREYGVGCVLLAGDAAHCHSPAGGRGMNLGIADASELAQRLAENDLSGYSDSRHAEGRRAIDYSERLRKVMTAKSGPVCGMRNTVFRLISRMPSIQRRLAVDLMDT